ncbi:DUF4249 domain-containing protein [Sediminibacterium ginsengisoli]|uniref:DUF4249 domain-containing protein n=1 Tax=Sediminibacterium ginsengisoli TaxID=413434 RepID=A0A1T4RKQ0_9BACT|nr:DUF4249 domain-containing protein [Sediminibacterium ginsengisoli]SKA16477.1 protein of unknown function [Sediminibacterium ginsengisoli]
MRYITSFLIPALALMLFSSCEKVIQVDLQNVAEPRYVIEGIITDKAGANQVLVSQTKNFSDNNSFQGVSGALVTVTDNNGIVTVFAENAKGIYTAPALTGVAGRTYNLKVVVAGKTFTSVSTVQPRIRFDSLFLSEGIIQDRLLPTVRYKDPVGLGNSYQFVLFINGVQQKEFFVRDDTYTDGNVAEAKLRYEKNSDKAPDNDLKKGDLVRVDMLCIDQPVYKYFFSLNNSSLGDNNSASPANPVSNIQGGALGYFSAHTVQTKTITVP